MSPAAQAAAAQRPAGADAGSGQAVPDQLLIQIARGFGAHGVLPAVAVALPAGAATDEAATAAATGGPHAQAGFELPRGAGACQGGAAWRGRGPTGGDHSAPVFVAALKWSAVLVALGGAYLAGLFVLGAPAAGADVAAEGLAAPAVVREVVREVRP